MPRSVRQDASARAQRPPRGGNGASAKAPKRTQRERLVDAMIELAAGSGYQNVSVAQVSARAGVSSATFYEQFEGKEDCLLAAYRAVTDRVLGQMQPVPAETVKSDSEWSLQARAALGRLLSAVQRDPDGGQVLYMESLAAGERMHEERRRVLGEFERRAEVFLDSTPETGSTIDLPATALMGAVRSIVSRHLRTHAEDELPALADDLVAWLETYARPPGQERWSTGPRALLPAAGARKPASGRSTRAPRRLPRGRHGLSAGVVARSQRTRIIYGTAEVMVSKGYANATVADIVAAAGVARDVFYEHFTDKQHAFLEAQQHPTQHILDTCAAAYFAAAEWPERVWNGLRTLMELIVENPEISHLRLVECYAAGPAAIRRAEDITRSFALFLEEGYRYRPQAHGLPRLCSQAIAGAIFEVTQRHIARGDHAGLVRHLPQLTYIAIAPFTGPEEAIRVLERLSA
ncbi:MAG TPA: TetR/AcrR family transcriptional regulator [Solirubrobacteraceae bacterium]|nr:TetR/AcrR family transcriptional regulator [Solirubrobacteraceae bacterium]